MPWNVSHDIGVPKLERPFSMSRTLLCPVKGLDAQTAVDAVRFM
jgi:hypothetical protein